MTKTETIEKETAIEVVSARVVRKQGLSWVIEYKHSDKLYRVIHPQPLTGDVPLESVEMGIPYGMDFATTLHPHRVTGEDIEEALHRLDIWTKDDVMTRPNEVLSAIQAVYGIDLAAILVAAQMEE